MSGSTAAQAKHLAVLLAVATATAGGIATSSSSTLSATTSTVWSAPAGVGTASTSVVVESTSDTALVFPLSDIDDENVVISAPNESLRKLLASPVAALGVFSLDAMVRILDELVTRRDPSVPGLVATRLQSSLLNSRWRAALVHAAEATPTDDQNVRASLAAGLLTSALEFQRLDDAASEPALWAAIRQLGGMVDPSQTGIFSAFLRKEDRLRTRQVVFQALQNVLAREPTSADLVPALLKARLYELAKNALNRDWLISGENVALAANAYCAAILARVENHEQLSSELTNLGHGVLSRQIEVTMSRLGVREVVS